MQAGQGGGGVQEECRQGLCGKGWLPTLSDCLDTALFFFRNAVYVEGKAILVFRLITSFSMTTQLIINLTAVLTERHADKDLPITARKKKSRVVLCFSCIKSQSDEYHY